MDSTQMLKGEQKIAQCTRILKVNCCFKVHNVHLKLALPISDAHFYINLTSITMPTLNWLSCAHS